VHKTIKRGFVELLVLFVICPCVLSAQVHAFQDSCRSIYPNGLSKPAGDIGKAGNRELKESVDALLYAAQLLVGILSENDAKFSIQGPLASVETSLQDQCAAYERVLMKVHGLELSSMAISDLTPFASLEQLEQLSVDNNGISDLGPLSSLTKLKSLDISGNNVRDLSPIKAMTTLVELRAISNKISDLKPLSNLKELQVLVLGDNEIGDITPIAGLLKLMRVQLQRNRIQNIAPLASSPALVVLNVNGNGIKNISDFRPPIRVVVDLSNNPIPTGQLDALIKVHPYNLEWTRAPYMPPDTPNLDAYINRQKTINVCTIIPAPAFSEHLPQDWPTCRDSTYTTGFHSVH
jgi:Leucine-rich repeat (LRR) protein